MRASRLNLLRLVVYGNALVLLLWAFWLEPSSLRVHEYRLEPPRWPAAQAGLRIALISDIHAGAPYIDEAKLDRIVALTQQAAPDLILLAGDYITKGLPGSTYMPPERIASRLAALRAPLGVYGVPGNHDHERGPKGLAAIFERHGIRMIGGQMLHIVNSRHRFWLTGIDPAADQPPFNLQRQFAPALADADPVLVLSHGPETYDLLSDVQRKRVALVMAGHTHGGQVNFPLFGRVMMRVLEPQPYEIGYYRELCGIFVTPGIGTSNLPARFRAPPEISILNLQAGS